MIATSYDVAREHNEAKGNVLIQRGFSVPFLSLNKVHTKSVDPIVILLQR